jgi:hypothetical protein
VSTLSWMCFLSEFEAILGGKLDGCEEGRVG